MRFESIYIYLILPSSVLSERALTLLQCSVWKWIFSGNIKIPIYKKYKIYVRKKINGGMGKVKGKFEKEEKASRELPPNLFSRVENYQGINWDIPSYTTLLSINR